MKFRTEIEITKYPVEVEYRSKIMFIGSCFAENIGNQLDEFCFNTDINPFGVLYNPASVAQSLKILNENRLFTDKNLQYRNELYFSFNHHSRFSDTDANTCLTKINERIASSSAFLHNCDFLFITFGTSWFISTKKTVK